MLPGLCVSRCQDIEHVTTTKWYKLHKQERRHQQAPDLYEVKCVDSWTCMETRGNQQINCKSLLSMDWLIWNVEKKLDPHNETGLVIYSRGMRWQRWRTKADLIGWLILCTGRFMGCKAPIGFRLQRDANATNYHWASCKIKGFH